jgi:hypothetical protein
MAKKKYRVYKAGGTQKGRVLNPTAKFLAKAQMGMQQPSPEEMQMMEQQAMQQQGQPQMSEQEMIMQQEQQMQMIMQLIEEYAELTQANPEEIFQVFQEAQDPQKQQAMLQQMAEVVQKANAGAADEVEAADQPMSKGGYVKNRVRQLKKAQEGMETPEELEQTPTINDTPDGRESLVSNFNQSLKSTAQNAAYKQQAEQEFDSENYQFGGGKQRRQQRRTNRRLRRAFKDIPMAYGINQMGVPSSGINVFAPAMMQMPSEKDIIKSENAENSEVTNEFNPQGINVKGSMKYGLFGRPKKYEFEMSGLPGAFTPFMGGMFGAGAMRTGSSGYYRSGTDWQDPVKAYVKFNNEANVVTNADEEQEMRDDPSQPSSDAEIKKKLEAEKTTVLSDFTDPYTTVDGETVMTNPNAPNIVSMEDAPMTKEEFLKLPLKQRLEIMENQLKSNKYYVKGDQYASSSGEQNKKIDGVDRGNWYGFEGIEQIDLNKMPEEYPINFNAAYKKDYDKPETYIYDYENPPENYSDYISQVKRHRDWLRSNKIDNYNDGNIIQWRHQDGEYKGQIRRDNAPDLRKHGVLDHKIDQWENATEEEKAALESEYSKEIASLNKRNLDRKTDIKESRNRDIGLAKGDEASIDYYLQDELRDIDEDSIDILDVSNGVSRWYTSEELLNMQVPELNEKRIEDDIWRVKEAIKDVKTDAEERGYEFPDLDSDNDEELLSKLKKYLSNFKEVTDDTYDYVANRNYHRGDDSGDLTPWAKEELLEAYRNLIMAKKLKEHYENLSESEKAAYDEKVYNNQKKQFEEETNNPELYDEELDRKEWERYMLMTEGKPNENFAPDFKRIYKKGGQVKKLKRYQEGGQPMLLSDMMMQGDAPNYEEDTSTMVTQWPSWMNPSVEEEQAFNADPVRQKVNAERMQNFLSGNFLGDALGGVFKDLNVQADPEWSMTSPEQLEAQKKTNEYEAEYEVSNIPDEQYDQDSDWFNEQLNPDEIDSAMLSLKTEIDQFALNNPELNNDTSAIVEALGILDDESVAPVIVQAFDSSYYAKMYNHASKYGTLNLEDTLYNIENDNRINLSKETTDTLKYIAKLKADSESKITADDLSGVMDWTDYVLLFGLPSAAVAYGAYKIKNRLPKNVKLSDFKFKIAKPLPGGKATVTPMFKRKALPPGKGSRYSKVGKQIVNRFTPAANKLFNVSKLAPKAVSKVKPSYLSRILQGGKGLIKGLGKGFGKTPILSPFLFPLYDDEDLKDDVFYQIYKDKGNPSGYGTPRKSKIGGSVNIEDPMYGNPDLYKFTGGGQDFMGYGGIPMAQFGYANVDEDLTDEERMSFTKTPEFGEAARSMLDEDLYGGRGMGYDDMQYAASENLDYNEDKGYQVADYYDNILTNQGPAAFQNAINEGQDSYVSAIPFANNTNPFPAEIISNPQMEALQNYTAPEDLREQGYLNNNLEAQQQYLAPGEQYSDVQWDDDYQYGGYLMRAQDGLQAYNEWMGQNAEQQALDEYNRYMNRGEGDSSTFKKYEADTESPVYNQILQRYAGNPQQQQQGTSSSIRAERPLPGFTWEQWEQMSPQQQQQAAAGAQQAYQDQRSQNYPGNRGTFQSGFNPFGALAGALTGMPYGMGNSRQKLFENTGGYWKQTGFPGGTIDPSNITKIHTEGKRGLFGPKGKMDIYFGGSGEAAADGVPQGSADKKRRGFPDMSYDARAERAEGRFDRRAQNAVDRRARKDARPGERAARQENRQLNREERQFERNRRQNIRQGRGDTGGFDRDAAIARRATAAEQAANSQQVVADPNRGYTTDKLNDFKAGDMNRRQLRKADFNRSERKQYRQGDVEGASEARKNRRRAARKQYGGYYAEGGEYDLTTEEILEIMQAGGQIEFI